MNASRHLTADVVQPGTPFATLQASTCCAGRCHPLVPHRTSRLLDVRNLRRLHPARPQGEPVTQHDARTKVDATLNNPASTRTTQDEQRELERLRRARAPLTKPEQLTAHERDALLSARSKLGTHRDNITSGIRSRLLEAGWLTAHTEKRLRITPAGRAALNAVIPEKTRGEVYTDPLLKVGHGLTTIPARAVQDAGVVIDPAMLDTRHATEALQRLEATTDTKEAARELRDLARQPVTLRDDIAAMKQRQGENKRDAA